ncbi:Predicted heme/steroid binding protein [Desulfuromusa kysingii]|uniref:Predicted heme/steroid binding protein n=1 Tax=Desulfuromusa kysingii TaxID=37625 RepID=A0A1H3WBP0_9BACT|nr:cytochrome b5 domain-containing protein [Desulfuromusa kysingii]SDZ83678.1 Predicted heme/steroid binding protein [Desulfuromusa kysingii]
MTITELAKFDGRDGQPAYVAVNGKVYDVSASSYWQDGLHEGEHRAGQDLTAELRQAPHLKTVIEGFPLVGQIESKTVGAEKPEPGISLLSIVIIAFVILLMLATYMV